MTDMDTEDTKQLLAVLPILKEAALLEKTGAATQLAEISKRADEVGMVALTLHGELLCNPDYPRFNPGLGLEKLKATALRGGESRGRCPAPIVLCIAGADAS